MRFPKYTVLATLAAFLIAISFPPAAAATPLPAATTTASSTTAKKRVRVHYVRRRHTRRHRTVARRYSVRRTTHRRVARRRVRYSTRRTASLRTRRRVSRVHYRRVRYSRARRRYIHYRSAIYRRHYWSPWTVSSYSDPTLDDNAEGQVESIRDAAVKALGRWNGSIVVVNPNTGRILALVNQKLALTRGYIPCSTVKPMVALAGLDQGVINMNTELMGMHGRRVDLTQALARSDNRYFAQVGEMLGFNRVEEYAKELGYGQRATLDVAGESAGVFPSEPPPKSIGGVGRLTSFGTGIDQTPLQMAALVSAIANGGTLYWLQYPRTPQEIADFRPEVRRVLTNLKPFIPEVRQGMAAAVLYGTAREAYNPREDIFGKTGTCSEDGGRMGWFISYSELEHPKYVVVVMLRGGRPMFGPHAAEIAGQVYRALLPSSELAEAQQSGSAAPEPVSDVNRRGH